MTKTIRTISPADSSMIFPLCMSIDDGIDREDYCCLSLWTNKTRIVRRLLGVGVNIIQQVSTHQINNVISTSDDRKYRSLTMSCHMKEVYSPTFDMIQ